MREIIPLPSMFARCTVPTCDVTQEVIFDCVGDYLLFSQRNKGGIKG